MIQKLSVKNRKIVVILLGVAVLIPVVLFFLASSVEESEDHVLLIPTPTQKAPLPTFPDAPRVEEELIIQYSEGQEFDNLVPERQQEILSLFESFGVISQERAYEAEEGALSRYYLLKFQQGTNIEEVAQQIYLLPEVVNAEPNTQFETF